VTDPASVPEAPIAWTAARRIIRSLYPPVDLFEDIADPADWPLLIAAEARTNPRLAETLGRIDLVPPDRRVSGPGASYLMAPFTHCSPDRPSRFTTGHYGVLYAARGFGTALAETIHHHGRFMARTREPAGWTAQFREIVLDVDLRARDLRDARRFADVLRLDDYGPAQALGAALRTAGADGIVYPSRRDPAGTCVALFHPDCAANAVQGRHLAYHWDGARVDRWRDMADGRVRAVGAS